ncbi:MAG: DNA polymerase IV [Gordonia amarae]
MTTAEPPRCRWLLHVDLDQFQVAVERLRSPELASETVIVGGNGDPTEARKVVTCASYEARGLGVRAGMPLRSAHRKAPDAVYLPVDAPAYDTVSAEVMDVLRAFGHPVEVWGWDEAFIGVGPVGEPGLAADEIQRFAIEVRTAVLARCGLECCIGISDNKQRAKMATGFAKAVSKTGDRSEVAPDRVFLLDDGNWLALMAERDTRELWSVGPKTAQKLAAHGIGTVAELIGTPRDRLISIFGPHQGNWLYVLCRGGGDSSITVQPWVAKSHSKSRTFARDLTGPDELAHEAGELARELLKQVVAEKRDVFRVAVTVRTTTFYTRTKSHKLRAATVSADDLLPEVEALLAKFELDRPVRLLGVRFDLLDDEVVASGVERSPDSS